MGCERGERRDHKVSVACSRLHLGGHWQVCMGVGMSLTGRDLPEASTQERKRDGNSQEGVGAWAEVSR